MTNAQFEWECVNVHQLDLAMMIGPKEVFFSVDGFGDG